MTQNYVTNKGEMGSKVQRPCVTFESLAMPVGRGAYSSFISYRLDKNVSTARWKSTIKLSSYAIYVNLFVSGNTIKEIIFFTTHMLRASNRV